MENFEGKIRTVICKFFFGGEGVNTAAISIASECSWGKWEMCSNEVI